ncbi:MAG: hypothetical protein MZV70_11175 [Desulfobacterales bacterium]|nr:hypothetical protein [Desulfobacterales bacterium]
MEDEFDLTREKAVGILAAVTFILCQPAIFFLSRGVVDELDFGGGTFGLVLFATIEVILFALGVRHRQSLKKFIRGPRLNYRQSLNIL